MIEKKSLAYLDIKKEDIGIRLDKILLKKFNSLSFIKIQKLIRTGFFKVNITPKGRTTTTETFTGAVVGSGTVNGITLEDGDFTFAVQSRNEDLVITLTNDEYLPSAFINAEWQGYFTQKSSQNT